MRRTVKFILRPAFTLIELFLVIAILAIAVTLGVPTFSAMIEGTNRSLAQNALREAVRQARDLAASSREDAAAVFLYEPGGRLRVVPMVKVGVLEEIPGDPFVSLDPNVGGVLIQQGVSRDVFAPAPGAGGTELPEGWMVRGYVPGGRMGPVNASIDPDPDWYDSFLYDENDLSLGSAKSEGNWVAPESGYFNPYAPGGQVSGQTGGLLSPRHTFMVRFEGQTGLLRRDADPAIVIDPRPSTQNAVPLLDPTLSIELADDLRSWAQRVLTAPATSLVATGNDSRANQIRAQLLGKYSNDTVVAGVVTRLAAYRVKDLADGLGLRGVNALTGTIYEPPQKQRELDRETAPTDQLPIRIDWDAERRVGGVTYPVGALTAWRSDPDALRVSINQWIEGDTERRNVAGWSAPSVIGDGDYDDEEGDRQRAAVFIVDTLSGELVPAVSQTQGSS
jgi:prepilin-type N-terminal cleavage/methylation domain-containing protein